MRTDGDYISRKTAYQFFKDQLEEETGAYSKGRNAGLRVAMSAVMNNDAIPAADLIDEENVLKFYYVRSTDDYWIGQRVGNFYYAEFDPEAFRWTWTHSRYLPWGEHVVSPTSLWKEHTYPSKPEEMPFGEWLRGLIKKYFPIQPHGRLIDVAALWVEINKICDRRDAGIISDLTCVQQLLSAVRHAPTIIPAEPLNEEVNE